MKNLKGLPIVGNPINKANPENKKNDIGLSISKPVDDEMATAREKIFLDFIVKKGVSKDFLDCVEEIIEDGSLIDIDDPEDFYKVCKDFFENRE